VFVVSEDAAVRDSVKDLVESAGMQVETFSSLQAFLDAAPTGRQVCLILDTNGGLLRDPERWATLATACARTPTLLITDRGDVPVAVRAVRAGAVDVVEKPYRDQNLLDSINKVIGQT